MKLLDENAVINLAKWTIEQTERLDGWGESIDAWRKETNKRITALDEWLTEAHLKIDEHIKGGPPETWNEGDLIDPRDLRIIDLQTRLAEMDKRLAALEADSHRHDMEPQPAPQAAEEPVRCPVCGEPWVCTECSEPLHWSRMGRHE